MAEITNYLRNKLLDHTLRVAAYTQPSALYLGLYTVAPTEAGGGTEVPVANGYARKSITFAAGSSGVSTNSNLVEFANTGWSGTIVAIGLFDASAGGNLLYFTTISPSLVVIANQLVTANIGGVSVSFP